MSTTEKQLPNLYIPGAAKAGTTSLANYLGQHPDIFMAPLKEPHFFSRIRPAPHLAPFFPHVTDEDGYRRLFCDAAAARWVAEASTSYLWDPQAPYRIQRASPEARFVVLLRDPAERAWSHYLNDVREGFEKRTFGQAVEEELAGGRDSGAWGVTSLYLDCGFYAQGLERYLDLFGDRVLILLFEELVRDPKAGVEEVFRFLDVDATAATRISFDVHNPYSRPRNRMAAALLGSGWARRLGRRLVGPGVRGWVRRAALKTGR